MGRFYVRLATWLQGILIVAGLFFYVLLHPVTNEILLQKLLTENGIRVGRVEGNLLVGFDLYNVRYQQGVQIARLGIHYTLGSLLSAVPTIGEVVVQGLRLYPDRLKLPAQSAEKSGTVSLPPIVLARLKCEGCEVFAPRKIAIDGEATQIRFEGGEADIGHYALRVATLFGAGRFEGDSHHRRLEGEGRVMPAPRYRKMAARYVADLPAALPVRYTFEKGVAILHTALPQVRIQEQNISVRHFDLKARYHLEGRYLQAFLTGHLVTPWLSADMNHSLVLTQTLAYALKSRMHVVQSRHPLPSDTIRFEASGDRRFMTATLVDKPYTLHLYTTDYNRFALNLHAPPHTPRYARELPGVFAHQIYTVDANASLALKPHFVLDGDLRLDGNFTRTTCRVETRQEKTTIVATLQPLDNRRGIWASLPEKMRRDIFAVAYLTPQSRMLNLTAPDGALTVFEKGAAIHGWANVGPLSLKVRGRVGKRHDVDLDFLTHISSLHALMEEFGLTSRQTIDAEIESRFALHIADRVTMGYEFTIPWYLYQPDSTHVYYGLDSSLKGRLRGREATVDAYDIGFMRHRFVQHRPSRLHLESNGTVVLDRIAVLDTGLLRGRFAPKTGAGRLRFDARAMHYRGPEGNLTLDAALTAAIDPGRLDVEGDVQLLEGRVTYMPPKEYTVNDSDIVIVEDIRPPDTTRKSLNIHIFSKKPLRYVVPMVDVSFIPDITIWKEPLKPTVLLGMVTLTGGTIDVEEKRFLIRPSHLYFAGAYPPNPYLDIHIEYDLDFNRFHIYVSHTLSDPVFLFSSEPPMNQNDIMSYILFGTPADESFQGGRNGGDMATMILGLGLKNAIGAATGLKFDTFNILNTESGGFGIEVGKRIGKHFRIIYRNDTLSSFIIQYTLSRSLRVEVDVKETGQGINILYVKDFRGPAALNRRW